MLKENDCFKTEQIRHYEMEEKVMQLFTPSSQTAFAEEEMDVQVDNLGHDFLDAIAASTDIDFNSLLEKFCDSQLPIEPSNFESYIEYLANSVITHSVHTSSPRFIE